jgi:hypothetical protein
MATWVRKQFLNWRPDSVRDRTGIYPGTALSCRRQGEACTVTFPRRRFAQLRETSPRRRPVMPLTACAVIPGARR